MVRRTLMAQPVIVLAALAVALATQEGAAALVDCKCYWNSDCIAKTLGKICNYTDNLTAETKCNWKKPKRNDATDEVPQCSQDDGDAGETGAGGDCDGICQETRAKKSGCANEISTTLGAAIQLWGDAVINVAEAGGGRIDPALALEALSTPADARCAVLLGRNVGSTLMVIAGKTEAGELFVHPEEIHDFQGHTVGDLSAEPCIIESMRRLIQALVSEVNARGSGAAIVATIPSICPQALDNVEPCPDLDNLSCLTETVADLGVYLSWGRVKTIKWETR